MSKINILKPTGTNVPYGTSNSTNYIVNQNGGGNLKFWRGTKTEYDALRSIDADTIYFLIEDK